MSVGNNPRSRKPSLNENLALGVLELAHPLRRLGLLPLDVGMDCREDQQHQDDDVDRFVGNALVLEAVDEEVRRAHERRDRERGAEM